ARSCAAAGRRRNVVVAESWCISTLAKTKRPGETLSVRGERPSIDNPINKVQATKVSTAERFRSVYCGSRFIYYGPAVLARRCVFRDDARPGSLGHTRPSQLVLAAVKR